MYCPGLLIHALLILLMIHGSAGAQYIFTHLNTEKGLTSDHITCLLQDREGFLWIGTDNGLNRFDGAEVVQFLSSPDEPNSLSDNFIYSLCEDMEGTIWIGTRSGELNRLDRCTFEFSHFTSNHEDTNAITEGFNKFVITDRRGNLFVAISFLGMDQLDMKTGKFRNLRPTDQIPELTPRPACSFLCCTADPADHDMIWIGSLQGIFSYQTVSGTWRHYSLTPELAENPSQFNGREQGVRRLLFDSRGELWFATWGGGLGKLNTQSGTFRVFKYEDMYPSSPVRNNVLSLAVKSEDEIWIATHDMGLGVFNTRTESFYFLTDPASGKMPVHIPTDIIVSERGELFTGSSSSGVYYTDLTLHQFPKLPMPFTIRALGTAREPSHVWVASMERTGKLYDLSKPGRSYTGYTYQPADYRSENFYIGIFEAGQYTWLAETYNIYRFNAKSGKIDLWPPAFPLTQSTSSDVMLTFNHAVMDQENNIWLGSKFHGLFVFNPGSGEFKNFYHPDTACNSILFNEFIFSLYVDRSGRIWYGSTDFGYYDNSRRKFTHFIYPDNVVGNDIKVRKVTGITETADGRFWIGTESSGIAQVQIVHDTAFIISHYTVRSGLSTDGIRQLITDWQNNVWALTEKGISRIHPATGTIENYGRESGLTGLSILFSDKDGEILIGARNGIYYFYPEGITPKNITHIPYIKAFRVFDTPCPVKKDSSGYRPIRLKHFQNFFSIEFGFIGYSKDVSTDYLYRLDGLDTTWQHAGERRYISYANLSGGNYLFRLKEQGGEEITLPVFIQTPFRKTWIFYVLMGLLALGLAVLLHIFRMKQVKSREKIRTEYSTKISHLENAVLRAQMNPHFLFNSLNSIRYYILKKDHENASDYITKFARLLRLILRHSRQTVVSLKEEINALKIYVEFEQMRFSDKFDFHLEIDEAVDMDRIMVQPLTIQPFAENAIWHGLMPLQRKGNLHISVSVWGNILKVIITDDGIGRKQAAEFEQNALIEKESMGLKIMTERMKIMESISGKSTGFRIEDLSDEHRNACGTRVTIELET